MRSKEIADRVASILTPAGPADLFPELAVTLYVFISRLHKALASTGCADVYFLSREGQPLQELYEIYRESRDCSGARAHYLQVSRRATLLPSLSELEGETFETLFRQYRAISIREFLSSLGLELYLSEFAASLGVDEQEFERRMADLPTAPLFIRLRETERFRTIYECERQQQRQAFLSYFTSLCGPTVKSAVAIVDVGWKGTIQDNLHVILTQAGVASSVEGYYLGLVAPGRVSSTNSKCGLLFSALPDKSRGFHAFNENRALFEVMLAADHPSVWRYATQESIGPLYGPFEEEEMIRSEVLPLQRYLVERFRALLQVPGLSKLDDECLGTIAAEHHARMVFCPTKWERTWFSKVFHVENFGVFQRSEFAENSTAKRLGDRVRFCIELLTRRGREQLGFWPYKALLERAGYPVALIYSIARRYQLR